MYVGIVTLELGANELVFRGKCVSSVTRKSIDLYIYMYHDDPNSNEADCKILIFFNINGTCIC